MRAYSSSSSTQAKCWFVFTSVDQDEMKVNLSGSLSHRDGWSHGGRCFWGSVCSNDAVCWAGNGAVIPAYSPQWRTLIGWIILVFPYCRILKAECRLITRIFSNSFMCFIMNVWHKTILSIKELRCNHLTTELTPETRQSEFLGYKTWSSFVVVWNLA